MPEIIHKFNSVEEFTLRIQENPQHHYNMRAGASYGADNVAQALRIATEGWREQRPTADRVMGEVMGSVSERVDMMPQMVMDVCGSAIDMGAYMSGEPECMMSFPIVPEERQDKVLKVLLDPGASAGYSAEYLASRAAAVAALLDVLQVLGHSLEIWLASPVKDGRISVHATVVKVNTAGRHVSLDDIMFWCGHPALLRRLVFTHRSIDGVGDGMGATMKMPKCVIDAVDPDLVLERGENVGYGIPDPGYEPAAWVLHTLKGLGFAVSE
jgi:hypothetical protein